MHVIITCKFEKDQIKNSREKVATPFSFFIITLSVAMGTSSRIWPNFKLSCMSSLPGSLWGFFRCSRAANSAVRGPIWLNFELLQALMHVIVTCKYKKGSDEKQLRKSGSTVFSIMTLWELSVAMETRVLIQSGPIPKAAFPPSQ